MGCKYFFAKRETTGLWQLEFDLVIHNSINVHDSLYNSVGNDTKQAILNTFKKVGQVKINSVHMQTHMVAQTMEVSLLL